MPPLPKATQQRERERLRIRAALIAVVAQHGYTGTTLPAVLDRAGLDRATFERHYSDLDACVIAIWEECTHEFLEVTGSAYAATAGRWREGMRAAAWAYARYIQEDEERARFLIELSFRSELVRASRDFVMDAYAELVHLGRHERAAAAAVPRAQAEGIVGAIWERIANTIMSGQFSDLPAAIPELMYLTVLPYLGAEAAREELRRGPDDIARYERGEL